MYDILLKGGEVIDPARGINGRRDIAISSGRIASVADEIPPGQAKKVIDARGKLVTPGLIDLHLHVADGIIGLGLPADKAGVLSGVTTVCDGGSVGCRHLPEFRQRIVSTARTDVFCFLNIFSTGLAAVNEMGIQPELEPDVTLRTAIANRDVVKGIKLQAITHMVGKLGIEVVKQAKRVAREAGMPLMVHIGDLRPRTAGEDVMDAFTRELLPYLEKGDILLHVFTWGAGGVLLPDGTVMAEFREAMNRGVLIDPAHGMYHISFELVRRGLAQGIVPATISSDLSRMNAEWPVVSLLVTMSKFLALGLSLDQVVEMTTINPARALGEEHRRGTLKLGMPADVSILEMTEGEFSFADGKAGGTLVGKFLLSPYLTLKSGVEIAPEGVPAKEVLAKGRA